MCKTLWRWENDIGKKHLLLSFQYSECSSLLLNKCSSLLIEKKGTRTGVWLSRRGNSKGPRCCSMGMEKVPTRSAAIEQKRTATRPLSSSCESRSRQNMLSGVTAAGATFLCFCLVLLVILVLKVLLVKWNSVFVWCLKALIISQKKSPYSKK